MGVLIAGPRLEPGERVTYTLLGNHTASSWRAVGGRLSVTNQAIHFSPHRFDALLRGKALRIELVDVTQVEARRKDGSDVFAGGLRDRLLVRTSDSMFMFVVNRLDQRIDDLRLSVANATTGEPRDGGGS